MIIEITFAFLLGIISGVGISTLVLLFIRDNHKIEHGLKKIYQPKIKKGFIPANSEEEQSTIDYYNQDKDIKIK